MQRDLARTLALLACAVLIVACTTPGPPADTLVTERGEITTTSGVKYEDTFIGIGPAAGIGDQVMFEYTLWLENGTRVDSTADRGYPVKAVLGEAQLKGWNDGLLGVQMQGERRITVPPELAYGAQGLPGMIPPNATLIFDVHVIEVTRPKK
jgi:FKBP-type peptidyl-prolyl cis-trans isomerase